MDTVRGPVCFQETFLTCCLSLHLDQAMKDVRETMKHVSVWHLTCLAMPSSHSTFSVGMGEACCSRECGTQCMFSAVTPCRHWMYYLPGNTMTCQNENKEILLVEVHLQASLTTEEGGSNCWNLRFLLVYCLWYFLSLLALVWLSLK